jgi:hypothetical protein
VDNETAWLPVPDVADRLGVSASRVRDLLKEGALLAVRRGENNALYMPEAFLVEVDGVMQPLATLKGTLTLLADAGFDDDAAMEWLLAPNDELGDSPIAELRLGHRSHVRRVAQALF